MLGEEERSMRKIDRSQVVRIGAELALVFVGVLLAFQFENFREERDTRSRTLVQLSAIRTELGENLERLETVIGRQNIVSTAQVKVLKIANGVEPFLQAEEMSLLVRQAAMFFRTEPITGAYDALVASGDLRMIDDPGLRGDLATFMGDLRQPFEDEENSLLFRTELFDVLHNYLDYMTIRAPNSVLDYPEPKRIPDFEGLLSDQRYVFYIGILSAIERAITRHYENLSEQCQSLIVRLETEVASI